MVHVNFPASALRSTVTVSSRGPPCLPAGSSVADIDIRRFGSVGPITEQKYMSQTVNASASA